MAGCVGERRTVESVAIIPRKRFMHIHILGICGTFMGGIALLARAAGHRVTGCDANVYPPMSTQLEEQGIELVSGYDSGQLALGARPVRGRQRDLAR
jgi:UDP-N-acetylmuramate-alanine ligase